MEVRDIVEATSCQKGGNMWRVHIWTGWMTRQSNTWNITGVASAYDRGENQQGGKTQLPTLKYLSAKHSVSMPWEHLRGAHHLSGHVHLKIFMKMKAATIQWANLTWKQPSLSADFLNRQELVWSPKACVLYTYNRNKVDGQRKPGLGLPPPGQLLQAHHLVPLRER